MRLADYKPAKPGTAAYYVEEGAWLAIIGLVIVPAALLVLPFALLFGLIGWAAEKALVLMEEMR